MVYSSSILSQIIISWVTKRPCALLYEKKVCNFRQICVICLSTAGKQVSAKTKFAPFK